MSSDYIPRLRHELLRAGAAAERRRVRPLPRALPARLLAVAATVAALAVAVGLVSLSGGSDETAFDPSGGDVRLTFRVEPAGGDAAAQTARMIRSRFAAAGVAGSNVSITSGDDLRITAPASAKESVTALVEPGRLAIQDWEPSLLGPGGAPDESSAGGDPLAAGVTRAEARRRAAARPGGRVVQDVSTGAWFALAGDPALTEADVANAKATMSGSSPEPVVEIEFTDRGAAAFSRLTGDVARRGTERARDGSGGIEGYQHFAIVLDGRILALPFVDHVEARNGLDGSAGTRIQGALTEDTARNLAAVLSTGPLPAALEERVE